MSNTLKSFIFPLRTIAPAQCLHFCVPLARKDNIRDALTNSNENFYFEDTKYFPTQHIIVLMSALDMNFWEKNREIVHLYRHQNVMEK